MGWNTYYRFVLLVEGRRRRRAEDGAAVRGGPEMRPCCLTGSGRETGQADAAPAGGARNRAPGRPPASRPPALRPAAHEQGCTCVTMKERWPPLRIRAVMACRRPEARPQGDRKRRKWSAGRRLPPIARRKETPSQGVSGGFASRSGGLANPRVCRRSAPLGGERDDDGSDGVP